MTRSIKHGVALQWIAPVAAAASLVIVGYAFAQSVTAKSKPPVLHEDLPSPNRNAAPSPTIGATNPDRNPEAIVAGDKTLPEPSDIPPEVSDGKEPVLGSDAAAADRSTEQKMDLQTSADGTLHYTGVFNPDVLPFKRMSALDGVSDDYTMVIAHSALQNVPVGGKTDGSRDRFWGSVLVKLSPGVDVALPSVAPDMRILSAEMNPKLQVRFSKDGADNFYVRSDDPAASGTFRLRFLADADARYFAPSLPTSKRYTIKDVTTAAPAALRPTVSAKARAAAAVTLSNMGIDRNSPLGTAFNKLVSYYRGFAAQDRPPNTGDIYRDLNDSQAGVCRHRAFAFMITANALGIPTRFVSNEAHAFVEVWFPEHNWQRIDLGGAASELAASGMEDKVLHRPRAEDPFAKPDEYRDNYTQLTGNISGLSSQQLADKKQSTTQAPSSGDFSAVGGGSGDGTGSGTDGDSKPAAGSPPAVPDDKTEQINPDQSLPTTAPDPRKESPRLMITLADSSAYRGGLMMIEGQADSRGVPIANHLVEIFIAPAGQRGKDSVSLGRVVTDASGRFKGELNIPASVNLARHEIFASSPGTLRFNAALSQ
jgi:hypothetical protein